MDGFRVSAASFAISDCLGEAVFRDSLSIITSVLLKVQGVLKHKES